MKKILAAAVVLLATTTAMFAEVSLGVHGILGFGTTKMNPGSFDSYNLLLENPDTVLNGGFGLYAKMGGALGGGDNKFLIGFQPGVEFIFGRAEKVTKNLSDLGTVGSLVGSITGNSFELKRSYNTFEIPLLLYVGGRVNKFDFTFKIGPNLVVPLGKVSNTFSIDGKEQSKTVTDAALLAAGVYEPYKLIFGIGGVAGVELGYNFTKNHGLTLGYQFRATYMFGKRHEYYTLSSSISYVDQALVMDFGSLNLGYRYTF